MLIERNECVVTFLKEIITKRQEDSNKTANAVQNLYKDSLEVLEK
jgi:hypothetical protein